MHSLTLEDKVMPSNYLCPQCDGDGLGECECCGSEIECESCNGSGLNAAILDINRLKGDEREILGGITHGYYVDGEHLGRQNLDCSSKLLFEDYRKDTPDAE